MISFEQLLVQLIEDVVSDVSTDGLKLSVTGYQVKVPLESRLGLADDDTLSLSASLPRGRWVSGFEQPLGLLETHWERVP